MENSYPKFRCIKGIPISTRHKRSNSKRGKDLHRRMGRFNLNFGLLFTISSIILILPTGILYPLMHSNEVFASTPASTFDNSSVPFSDGGR